MEAWDGIGNDAAYNHAQTPRGASAHANSKDASKKPEAVEGVSGTALRFTDYDVVATRSAMTLRQHTFAAWVKAYGDIFGSQRIIVAFAPTTGSKGIFAGYLGTGDSHFMVTAAENVFPNSTVSAQDTENWHHVASTFDGRRILLHVSGPKQQGLILIVK